MSKPSRELDLKYTLQSEDGRKINVKFVIVDGKLDRLVTHGTPGMTIINGGIKGIQDYMDLLNIGIHDALESED